MLVHHVQMFDTGGEEEKLDVLEPGEGEGVDDLDGVVVDHLVIFVIQCESRKYTASIIVVDHQHRDVLGARESVTLDGVDSVEYNCQQHEFQKSDFQIVRSAEFQSCPKLTPTYCSQGRSGTHFSSLKI